MAEIRTTSSSGGQKGMKAQAYDKLPPRGLHDLAVLFSSGSNKYSVWNWIRGYEFSKSLAGLQRHISLFWSGEDRDLELGTLHSTNAAWHCAVLYTNSHLHPEFDDRPTSLGRQVTPGVRPNIDEEFPTKYVDLESYNRAEGEISPRFDLIPNAALAELATLYGAKVDGVHLITPVIEPELWSSYYNRLQEHVWKFWGGEDHDKHGFHHMIYALHYALCLNELYYRFPEYDDRFTERYGAQPIGFDSAPTPKD